MKIKDVAASPMDTMLYQEDGSLPLPRCNIGIEIELENIHRATTAALDYWEAKPDGSLRNNGREFAFRRPLFGKDITEALAELNRAFATQGIVPDCSERTSVHVHIDVRDMDADQLLRMVVLYLVLERTLVRHCRTYGVDREENIFCLPHYIAESDITHIAQLLTAVVKEDARLLRQAVGEMEKYHALNLRPISTFGSVEFRHMPGTHSIEDIMEWVRIIQCIKKWAINNQIAPDTILNMVSGMGAEEFMVSVFGNLVVAGPYDSLRHDLMEGARLSQDALYLVGLDAATHSFTKVRAKAKPGKLLLSLAGKDKVNQHMGDL